MSDRDTRENRDAIDRVAADYRNAVRRSGGDISQEDARRRVASARARGDRIRENGNR